MSDADGQEENPNKNPKHNPNPVPVIPDPQQVLPEGLGLGLATQNKLMAALLERSIASHEALVTYHQATRWQR